MVEELQASPRANGPYVGEGQVPVPELEIGEFDPYAFTTEDYGYLALSFIIFTAAIVVLRG